MLRMIPSFDLSFSLMAMPIKTCKNLEAILLHSFLCDEIRNNQIGATSAKSRAGRLTLIVMVDCGKKFPAAVDRNHSNYLASLTRSTSV